MMILDTGLLFGTPWNWNIPFISKYRTS